jgi:hypothetical protein
MAFFDSIKNWFQKDPDKKKDVELEPNRVSIFTMETKYDSDDLVGAAKDLKVLLELYGASKKQNHRYKGREFIYFILSSKHKDLKTIGYTHWKNINQIITLNHKKAYPYHKINLRNAMDFFKKEIRSLNNIDRYVE